MQVTNIQEFKKRCYRIWLDGEVAFVLYKGDLRHYGIYEGMEIDEALYETILREVLSPRAQKRALHLLGKRDYTSAALRRKLLDGGYPEKIAQTAVESMESYHYLDDERYADQYIRCYAGRKSRMEIRHKLAERGIDKELIERVYELYDAEGNGDDEEAIVVRLLHKRHYYGESAEKKEIDRHIAYLVRKGFSVSCIKRAMRLLQEEYESADGE